MKKLVSFLILSVFILIVFTSCTSKYNEKKILGQTSAALIAAYGEFDLADVSPDADGLYRNCRCGYTIKEPKVGFLGTSPEILLFIKFDENGIAVACEEGYRPGG
jgi:hypothetical protein